MATGMMVEGEAREVPGWVLVPLRVAQYLILHPLPELRPEEVGGDRGKRAKRAGDVDVQMYTVIHV